MVGRSIQECHLRCYMLEQSASIQLAALARRTAGACLGYRTATVPVPPPLVRGVRRLRSVRWEAGMAGPAAHARRGVCGLARRQRRQTRARFEAAVASGELDVRAQLPGFGARSFRLMQGSLNRAQRGRARACVTTRAHTRARGPVVGWGVGEWGVGAGRRGDYCTAQTTHFFCCSRSWCFVEVTSHFCVRSVDGSFSPSAASLMSYARWKSGVASSYCFCS